jgi:hypothetical protein
LLLALTRFRIFTFLWGLLILASLPAFILGGKDGWHIMGINAGLVMIGGLVLSRHLLGLSIALLTGLPSLKRRG